VIGSSKPDPLFRGNKGRDPGRPWIARPGPHPDPLAQLPPIKAAPLAARAPTPGRPAVQHVHHCWRDGATARGQSCGSALARAATPRSKGSLVHTRMCCPCDAQHGPPPPAQARSRGKACPLGAALSAAPHTRSRQQQAAAARSCQASSSASSESPLASSVASLLLESTRSRRAPGGRFSTSRLLLTPRGATCTALSAPAPRHIPSAHRPTPGRRLSLPRTRAPRTRATQGSKAAPRPWHQLATLHRSS